MCFAAFNATSIPALSGNLYRRTVICAVFRVHMYDYHNDVGSLRVFMATLRKKIEKSPDSPQYIQTHVGVGYRMIKVE